MKSDGSAVRRIITAATGIGHPAWSPDGSHIAYVTIGAVGQPGWLMVARSDGTHPFRLVPDAEAPDWQPRPTSG